jgi:hypothetical protein
MSAWVNRSIGVIGIFCRERTFVPNLADAIPIAVLILAKRIGPRALTPVRGWVALIPRLATVPVVFTLEDVRITQEVIVQDAAELRRRRHRERDGDGY